MSFLANKGKRKIFIWISSVVLVIAIITVTCAVYLGDYYRADLESIAAFASVGNVSKEVQDDNTIVYKSEEAITGFIFYPGGKVEYTAYEPLMEACASQGIMCFLVEMPFNLAVLDMKAAEGIQEMYPEIEKWYIGGHSLGGSMAASYLADNLGNYEGLILLGSYSTADLSETSLSVLSIYGSEDKVLNMEKYNENKANLPEDFTEIIIQGGCHAYFGVYGEQDGDGTPEITNQEQIAITAYEIAKII